MSLIETFARLEHGFRPFVHALPAPLAHRIFSAGRTAFSKRFANEVPEPRRMPRPPIKAWGLEFQFPLWNAGGMFKVGEGYDVVAAQGAGAWVAGTTTSRPRAGNVKHGIQWPAVSYPRSGAATNWMGLPNPGHRAVASRIAKMPRHAGCVVAASVSAEPGLEETIALHELVEGVKAYVDAGVDVLEINESCPNVPGHHGGPALDHGLVRRLEYVAQHILAKRDRRIVVVVKFSTDTDATQLEDLLRTVVAMGFDGIILGNTSTQY
ncbi:MAG: hypothetical protein MUC47_05275, partial [Candidatus Kapabacteria bacterium]|nr:hypothetical protein [Candidatus Kapabacteria bacterium]